MTRDEANATASMFAGMGFTNVDVDETGSYNSGNWEVVLWSINAAAGNRNSYAVRTPVTSAKEAKLIAKIAKGKATDRDREALSRIAAEKAND